LENPYLYNLIEKCSSKEINGNIPMIDKAKIHPLLILNVIPEKLTLNANITTFEVNLIQKILQLF